MFFFFVRFVSFLSCSYCSCVRYVREYKALGTGGGLYHFRDLIVQGNPDYFFVLHADVVTDFHLANLLETHKAHGSTALATILGKKVPKERTHAFGVVVIGEDNKVVHYAEKPETFVSDVINCGVYCFSSSIFDKLGEIYKANHSSAADIEGRDKDAIRLEQVRCALRKRERLIPLFFFFRSFLQDVLIPLGGSGKLFAFVTESNWAQLKSAGSALPANALALGLTAKNEPSKLTTAASFTDKGLKAPQLTGPLIIHPSAKVDPSAKLGPNVSIGANVVIGAGVRVKDSIILDDVTIKVRV